MGEEYRKTIPFIKEDLLNAYKLWNKLKEDTIAEIKSSSPRKLKYNWFE